MNEMCFTFRDVPFYFMQFYGSGARLRVGNSQHTVFIPKIYFSKDGKLNENMKLDWYFKKYDINHKIDLINGNFNLEKEV